jgi:hypothetical protein
MSNEIYKSKLFKSIANNKILPIVFVIIFITALVLYARWSKKKILISPKLTDAIITKVYTARGINGFGIKYSIVNDSINYLEGEDLIVCDERRGLYLSCLLEGRKVQSVFEKNNPKNSLLLLTTHEYKEFNITIPTSLKKIIEYIDSVENEDIFLKESNNPCNH